MDERKNTERLMSIMSYRVSLHLFRNENNYTEEDVRIAIVAAATVTVKL